MSGGLAEVRERHHARMLEPERQTWLRSQHRSSDWVFMMPHDAASLCANRYGVRRGLQRHSGALAQAHKELLRYKKCVSRMGSYARAINKTRAVTGPVLISIDDWSPPKVSIDGDAPARAHIVEAHGQPPVDLVDMLDSAFMTFHRDLREFMVSKHGVMAHSEAFDLHEAVVPCITLRFETESTSESFDI